MTTSELKKEEKQLSMESITLGDLTWINIQNPTIRETSYLAENFHFHPLDLDDCLSRIQRPKIDEYKDYLFVILHFTIYNKEKRVSTQGQVSVFVGEKYLVTLHSGELRPLVKLFNDCQSDEAIRQQNFSYGSGFLFYRVIDLMVDAYFPILDKILSLMEDVEDSVFDENVVATHEIAILRRDIITQRRIIFPTRTVIGALENKLKRFTKVDISAYFGDVMDHIHKICESLDECKEIIEVYKDTDYVLSTERVNRVMRVLTILSSIILPFIAISSLYGMNVHLPGGLTEGNLYSFLLLLLAMMVCSGVMLFWFRRKGWI